MTRAIFRVTMVVALAGTFACSTKPDVEKVPVGADVQLTRQDGGVVEGRLAEKNATEVKVASGPSRTTVKTVPREEIADVKVVEPDKPAPLPAIAKFREYTVPEGTALTLALTSGASSETSQVEDPVEARLAKPVSVDGVEVIPAGSKVHGNVTSVQRTGKVKGRAMLALRFTTLVAEGDDHSISAPWSAEAKSTTKSDAKKIGIGAGAGAVIGGIIGGGKGAATGAAIGGGAGTAMVLTSAGEPIELRPGAEIVVHVADPFEVRVPVH